MALENANELRPLARKIRFSQELSYCYLVVKELMRIGIGSPVWRWKSREFGRTQIGSEEIFLQNQPLRSKQGYGFFFGA
jgi:hypothetical protein